MLLNAFNKIGCVSLLMLVVVANGEAASIPEKTFQAPHNVKISVKEIGPVTQTTDLQIIFVLKHNPKGDQYIEAMDDFNKKLGNLLSNLRERGEFMGELGETLLFSPPANSVTPRKILLIGVGSGDELTLEKFKTGARIAAREAVRLKAKHVSFAPTMRDQGNSIINVGDGDAAVAEQVILAYDTEKRLQKQKLAPQFDIKEWVIEAGPKYFDDAVIKVGKSVEAATATVKNRDDKPYVSKH